MSELMQSTSDGGLPALSGGERPATDAALAALSIAAKDSRHVAGWTHNFYRYPARFSPGFAAAAIEQFSAPGALVLDPYMGGGTAVIEAAIAGRAAIGNDLNSLATFVARVKCTALTEVESRAVVRWIKRGVPELKYDSPAGDVARYIDPVKVRNLNIVRARFLKKVVASALASIAELPTQPAQNFARCAVLRVSQWALDGRRRHTSVSDFRSRLVRTSTEMLGSLVKTTGRIEHVNGTVTLLNGDAAFIDAAEPFEDGKIKADLVVTSPPYPGVHVLYHRWQVDGRRESPAPYWIAGCNDGQGASFYNFGDRRQAATDNYFRASLHTLFAIRKVVRDGGFVIQLVAFSRPEVQLPRYLSNMLATGFEEVLARGARRIWRTVPNRKWHASLRGSTASAKEVVLVHRAI